MNIMVDVHFIGPGGSKILKSGDFKVNLKNFKKDEEKEAIRVAVQFVRQIQREYGKITLEKVLYNGNDITTYIDKIV